MLDFVGTQGVMLLICPLCSLASSLGVEPFFDWSKDVHEHVGPDFFSCPFGNVVVPISVVQLCDHSGECGVLNG